jgi:hypothetical protein
VFNINVVEYDGCFTEGSVFNISANAQEVRVSNNCCIRSIRETTNVGVTIDWTGDYIVLTVPENNTGLPRMITVLVNFCDGKSENITINQSNIFEKWEDSGGTFCIYPDKYKTQYLWTGRTSSSYVITTTHRDVVVERNSQDCILDRWVNSYLITCVEDGNLYYRYYLYKKQESYDGGYTWNDVYPAQMVASGASIGTYSDLSDCEEAYGSRWIRTDEEVCVGSDSGDGKLQFFKTNHLDTPYLTVPCDSTGIISRSDFVDTEYDKNNTYKIILGGCAISTARDTMGITSGIYKPRLFIINDGIREFGDYSFKDFVAYVKDLVIPDSVETIGVDCFYYLSSEIGRMTGSKIGTLTIGSGVKTIKWCAFYNCDYLKSITINATTPPVVSFGVFLGAGDRSNLCPIYVPAESLNAYKTSPSWVQYVDINRIQPIQ